MTRTAIATPDDPNVVIVRNYNDARRVGEALRERGTVLVDLRSIDEESDGRRILDFCAGAAFTMRANIEKLASGVFFVSKDQSSTPELRRRFTD